MKKILLLALLLLTQTALQAQTEKGRWTAGVSVGSFSYQMNEGYYNFSANLSPSAGRFIAPNFLIGIGVPLSLSSSRYGTSTNSNSAVGVAPFARYYFGTSSLKPFSGLALSYEYINQRSENAPALLTTTRGNKLGVIPSLGLAYFINRSISLDAQLNYNWSKSNLTGTDNSGFPYNEKSSYTTKNATLTLGFNIFFGEQ